MPPSFPQELIDRIIHIRLSADFETAFHSTNVGDVAAYRRAAGGLMAINRASANTVFSLLSKHLVRAEALSVALKWEPELTMLRHERHGGGLKRSHRKRGPCAKCETATAKSKVASSLLMWVCEIHKRSEKVLRAGGKVGACSRCRCPRWHLY